MLTRKKSSKKKYRFKKKFIRNVLVLLIIIVVGNIAIEGKTLYENTIDQDKFYYGIYIDDEPMDGLTKEQALESLEPAHTQKLEQVKILLGYEDKEWVLDNEVINLDTDYHQLVEESYNLGRHGNWITRIKEVSTLKKNPVNLHSEITYDTEKLLPSLQEIADSLYKQPVDAALAFHPDDNVKFTNIKEETGWELDIDGVYNEIAASLSQGKYDFTIQLTLNELQPKVHAADLTVKPEKLISFGTDLSKSAADRTFNVLRAASQFNGLVVQPGEIISFNETVGERTAARGYKSAPMIVADKSLQNATGGGVSQTSSTLYNAAIRSGLEVIEYQRHSFPVAYIDKGLDTTVNLPTPMIDIKVKNTKKTPIYLRTFYADRKVYFEVYGEPLPDGQSIRISTEEYEVVTPPDLEIRKDEAGQYVTYEDQKYVYVSPKSGYKVRVYREIIENGKAIEKEMLDDHYYRPIAGITYVGVNKRSVELEPVQKVPDSDQVNTENNDNVAQD